MKREFFAKAFVLLKYCGTTKIGGPWIPLFVLALFIGSYIWRNCLNGQHDSILFELLSLGVLWYVYCFGAMKTLYELRLNSNSFLMGDIKSISYWLGLGLCLIIYGATFLFLEQFGSAGCIVFLAVLQPGLIFGRRGRKWIDIVRLNTAGLTPFLLVNIYLISVKVFPMPNLWLAFVVCISAVFSGAIFYSHYKSWMNNPRNSNFLDVDYRYIKKYYRSNRGFD